MLTDNEIAQELARIIKAEKAVKQLKEELKQHELDVKSQCSSLEKAIKDAWGGIEAHMRETGEVEITVPSASGSYVIAPQTMPESCKVDDVNAVPDEFVKIERKAMIAEIKKYLKQLRDDGQPFPNWARLERGEASLNWRFKKD